MNKRLHRSRRSPGYSGKLASRTAGGISIEVDCTGFEFETILAAPLRLESPTCQFLQDLDDHGSPQIYFIFCELLGKIKIVNEDKCLGQNLIRFIDSIFSSHSKSGLNNRKDMATSQGGWR